MANEGRLSRRALDSMEDPTVPLFFSAASIWEMEIKRAKGKLDAPGDLLVAQSQCEDLTIVTHDERIASYQVPVLW